MLTLRNNSDWSETKHDRLVHPFELKSLGTHLHHVPDTEHLMGAKQADSWITGGQIAFPRLMFGAVGFMLFG